jgi:hypothetical protein
MEKAHDTNSQHYEFLKQSFEYIKHLTMLSTGAILLIATFLEKIFAQPRWKPLVAVSLAGFMATVVSGMVVHSLLLLFAFRGKEEPNWIALVGGFSTFLMWLGFIVGVVSLGIFGIKNLV